MKKSIKVFRMLLITLATISLATSVFATNPISTVNSSVTDTDAFDNVGGSIIGGLRGIGSIAAIAILVVLGLKYMMGSTEEKAEYKKTMLPYLIGAVFIFAASNIAGMVYDFASTIS